MAVLKPPTQADLSCTVGPARRAIDAYAALPRRLFVLFAESGRTRAPRQTLEIDTMAEPFDLIDSWRGFSAAVNLARTLALRDCPAGPNTYVPTRSKQLPGAAVSRRL